MDQTKNEKKSILSVLIAPFYIFFNILVYALKGLKVCLYDVWVVFFRSLNKSVENSANNTHEYDDEMQGIDTTYNKIKKKTKVYRYSEKTLAKLEKEKAKLMEDLQSAGATRSKIPHIYKFKVKEPNGKITIGTMSGLSKLDINAFLLNEGFEVYSIETNAWIDLMYKDSSFAFGGTRMSTKDLIFWLTQLSTYIKAGLTLNDSVKILNSQMKGSKTKKRAFQAIAYELTLGESFSNALAKQQNMFPPLLINMIKAAEASGTLVETLDDMAEYYTELNTTKKQMISAMTYPTIIMVFALGVITFILIWVVPKFTDIYDNYGAGVGGFTAFVINASSFLKNNILIILLLIMIAIIIIFVCYKTIKAFRTYFQIVLMHIPVVKDIIIYNELTIFAKTFSSLVKNNVFITDSMDILSKITNNEVYKAILYKTIDNIVKGEKISEAFKDHWAIPDVAYFMIVTGESTGQLATMMQKVSEYYQELHKNIINNLKAFIEPIMISFLAVVVGMIIIAVIVPMFGIYETIDY